MTKNRLILTFLVVICNILIATADNRLGYSKYQPLGIGLDLDYAPLEYVDQDGLPQGLDVKLTQELMRRMGIPYTYRPNTWENISGDVINGRVDLAMMVYSPYRKDVVNYSRAVFKLYYQVVYRNDSKEEFDMRHIAGKEIAYMSSRPVTDTLQRAGAKLQVVRDLPQAIKDLSEGRYDAIVCFRYQVKYHTKAMGITNLSAQDLTLTPREYCYVSQNRDLIRAIDRELVKMEKDGTIDDIYGDYISKLGNDEIPTWIWYALATMVVLFLIITIASQIRHAKRLRREMRRAQKSERLKTVFLANVSHALRTPLNAIIGFSDMMRSMPTEALSEEERKEMMNQIHDNGQQLLYFINELLQLSNIEGNGIEFQFVEANIRQLIEEYAILIEPQLQEGVELKIDAPEQEQTAIIDTNQLRLITMHLLTNAAKHTQQGSITISYKFTNGGLHVAVADTGDGLPEQLKNNIFALLNDQHTFIQEQEQNPGLGLSICKAVINAVHGKIGVESEQGKGSTFWFWFPCRFS